MKLFTLIFACLLNFYCQAFDPFPKFGEISKEDLSMERYSADTNAAAVVLSDIGFYNWKFENFGNPIIFERQVRIKILKTAGLSAGEVMIPYFYKYNSEKVVDIKAHTINLDENNKKVVTEVSKDLIFDQDINGYYHSTKFAFPDMKVGSVIEYYIRIHTNDFWSIGPWKFQGEYPVIKSSISTRIPDCFHYREQISGSLNFPAPVTEDYREYDLDGTISTFTLKDLPASTKESHCPNIKDFEPSISYFLVDTRFPKQPKNIFISDWVNMTRQVREHRYIGERIKTSPYFRELANEITKNKVSPEEKANAIYCYVKNNIVWNKYETIFAYEELKTVITERKGNSAEINLLLLSLLKSAGLDARMVLISTIDHGLSRSSLPTAEQFNNILVSLYINGKANFLNATDPNRSMLLTDKNDLTQAGFEVSDDKGEWVYLNLPPISRKLAVLNIDLDVTGTLKGSVDFTADGYNALSLVDKFSAGEEKALVSDLYKGVDSRLKFNSTKVVVPDSLNSNFKIKSEFQSSVSVENSKMYFTPLINLEINQNPFEASERKFPINFIYPVKETSIININIPEGYQSAIELDNIKILYPDSSISFSMISVINGSAIQIKTIFERQRSVFGVDEFNSLNDLYSKIIKLISKQIVLEKKV